MPQQMIRKIDEELEHVFDKVPKYHMKILLDFNAKVSREDVFKTKIWNESLHEISNDNGVRVVILPDPKILLSKVQCSHIVTFINLLGHFLLEKMHNPTDHMLIDRRRHSNILDVRSFMAADCDTDHFLVVAKLRVRLAVSKQTTHRVHMEKFNLKKLKEVEVKEQYHVEILKRFLAFKKLKGTEVNINRACKTIRENIKISP
jgi:hypothetical protein